VKQEKLKNSIARNYFLLTSHEGSGVGRTSIRPGISDSGDKVFVIAPQEYVERYIKPKLEIITNLNEDITKYKNPILFNCRFRRYYY
jgi:hypothetical protein